PINAAHFWIEESVAKVRPGLFESLVFLAIEVDVHLRADGDRPRLDRIDRRCGDLSRIEIPDLLAVARPLQPALASGAAADLLRDGGFGGQLVERIDVDVLQIGDAGDDAKPFAVGTEG